MNHQNQTITITLGDQAENHVGMQKIGEAATEGFSYDDLVKIKKYFDQIWCGTEIYELGWPIKEFDDNPGAYLLVIPGGVNALLLDEEDIENSETYPHDSELFEELVKLKWDRKALMYGRVVNKNARYNLCFGEHSQKPNYLEGKGRIIAYRQVPVLAKLIKMIGDIHPKCTNLVAEGNYYHDITKCGIGYHGDSERKKVVGVRLGATIPLDFQWFYKSKPVGRGIRFELRHGDIYIMSEKAVGSDWKNRNMLTLRHAAGCGKYVEI